MSGPDPDPMVPPEGTGRPDAPGFGEVRPAGPPLRPQGHPPGSFPPDPTVPTGATGSTGPPPGPTVPHGAVPTGGGGGDDGDDESHAGRAMLIGGLLVGALIAAVALFLLTRDDGDGDGDRARSADGPAASAAVSVEQVETAGTGRVEDVGAVPATVESAPPVDTTGDDVAVPVTAEDPPATEPPATPAATAAPATEAPSGDGTGRTDGFAPCTIVEEDRVRLDFVNPESNVVDAEVTVEFFDADGSSLRLDEYFVFAVRPGERAIEEIPFVIVGGGEPASCDYVQVLLPPAPVGDGPGAAECRITSLAGGSIDVEVTYTNTASTTADLFVSMSIVRGDGVRLAAVLRFYEDVPAGETESTVEQGFSFIDASDSDCQVVDVTIFAS